MALNKQDRIKISSRLAGIEDEISQADALAEAGDQIIIDAQNADSPNQKLLEERSLLINSYQAEALYLDGNERTELTNSIMEDSAKRLLGNSFFPNDTNSTIPSLSDNIWKSLIPYSKTHAIGRDRLESYVSTGNRTESDVITDISAKIVEIEGKVVANRISSQICEEVETDPGPPPVLEDQYSSDPIIQGLLTDLTTLVQEWEGVLLNQKAVLSAIEDSNSLRSVGNTNAVDDIDIAIFTIDSWQSVQDFDTTTTLPSPPNCTNFDSLTESYFDQSKLAPTTLQGIKDEIDDRTTFISNRISDLTTTYLGSITQDLETGSYSNLTGLYGERMLFIDLRINAATGTLSQVIASQAATEFQGKAKESAENAFLALSLAMKVSRLSASGINTFYIQVVDSTGFYVNDRIYLVADEQKELSGSIEEISGNRIKLTFKVPKKYTTDNLSRIYKVL